MEKINDHEEASMQPLDMDKEMSCLSMKESDEKAEEGKPKATVINNATVLALTKIKSMAATRAFHKKLLQEEASVGFAVLSLDSPCEETMNLSLDILQLLAQYPENRRGLKDIVHIFDALEAVIDQPNQTKEACSMARWISSVLQQGGIEIKKTKTHRRPLGERNPNASGAGHVPTKTERTKRNSKNVYLRVADVCLEANRNDITETLRKIEGIISITYVVQKSVCLILSHKKVPSEVYGKAVANLGFECALVAWDSNNEEVWIRQYSDKWEGSNSLLGNKGEPGYLPESDDEKDKSIGDQALVPEGQVKERAGGWLNSAANFIQKSFYW